MGRPDKREMQRRRALQGVESALSKGRIAEAAEALLGLPIEQRSAFLPLLGDQVASLLSERGASLDVAVRLDWLARVEREPRLLSTDEKGMRARWTLFQGALQAKQWAQLSRLFEQLRPVLADSPSRAPLEALVSGRDTPDPQAFAGATDDDERLGYDAPVRVSHPPPARIEDVERACLACLGLEPWPRFRDVVNGWLARRLPADVAHALRVTAALLSQREQVVRASQPRAALEVAQFCATLAGDSGAPPELEPAIAQALRAGARALVGTITDKLLVEAITKVAAAALAYPSLAPLVDRIVTSARYDDSVFEAAARLLQTVAKRRHSIAVVFTMCDLAARRIQHTEHANVESLRPTWLVEAFAALLVEAPEQVAEAFAERCRVYSPIVAIGPLDLMPIAINAQAIDVLWDRVPGAREQLARSGEHLLDRMRTLSSQKRGGTSLLQVRAALEAVGFPDAYGVSDTELRQIMRTMPPDVRRGFDAFVSGNTARAPLSHEHRALWATLSHRLVPHRASALEATLELTPDPRARRALVDQFWELRPTVLARLEALWQCERDGRDETSEALEKGLERRLGPVAQRDAARALAFAVREGAPRRLRNRMARLLIARVDADGEVVADPEVTAALSRARRLVQKPVKKKQKPASTKRRETRKRTRAQTLSLLSSLGLDEEQPHDL